MQRSSAEPSISTAVVPKSDFLTLRLGRDVPLAATISTTCERTRRLAAAETPTLKLRLDGILLPSGRDLMRFCDDCGEDFDRVTWTAETEEYGDRPFEFRLCRHLSGARLSRPPDKGPLRQCAGFRSFGRLPTDRETQWAPETVLRCEVHSEKSGMRFIRGARRVQRRLKGEGKQPAVGGATETALQRLFGKELLVLLWAIEASEITPEEIGVAIRNWTGLKPEERWWLYTHDRREHWLSAPGRHGMARCAAQGLMLRHTQRCFQSGRGYWAWLASAGSNPKRCRRSSRIETKKEERKSRPTPDEKGDSPKSSVESRHVEDCQGLENRKAQTADTKQQKTKSEAWQFGAKATIILRSSRCCGIMR